MAWAAPAGSGAALSMAEKRAPHLAQIAPHAFHVGGILAQTR